MAPKAKLIVFIFSIMVLSLIGSAGWKWFVVPHQKRQAQQQQADQKKHKLAATSAVAHYDTTVRLRLDNFAGYWVFRTKQFREKLAARKIRLDLSEDGGDYQRRYKSLQNGEIDVAVITLDADLITAASSQATEIVDRIPATAVMIIDETKGADALIGYRKKYPSIDSLNDPDTKFVLTPNSPSESLVRVLFRHFDLGKINKSSCFVYPTSDSKNPELEIYEDYRKSNPSDNRVWVVWSPWTTKMLENPNLHVIVDSSRFRGYIVDILVVNRDFLQKHSDTVKDIVSSYFQVLYEHRDDLPYMVKEDVFATTNFAISDKQAKDLVQGIWWKNFNENLAHMGVSPDSRLQSIEEMIDQVTDVLLGSGAISTDPSDKQPNFVYFNQILEQMRNSNFHPGISSDSTGNVRNEIHLPELSDEEWSKLQPVGTLQVPPLAFGRGTDTLLASSKETLDKLVANLNTWTTYYVTIRGDAGAFGNTEINKKLALSRARMAERYLLDKGIEATRIRTMAGEPTGKMRVSFVLGQQPY